MSTQSSSSDSTHAAGRTATLPALPEAAAQVFIGQGTKCVFTGEQMRAYAMETIASLGGDPQGLRLIGETSVPGSDDGEVVFRMYAKTGALTSQKAAQAASPTPAASRAATLPADAEQLRAIKEGERIASADTYFRLRHPMLDTRDRRNVFDAAFDRGYDAALAQAEAAQPVSPAPLTDEQIDAAYTLWCTSGLRRLTPQQRMRKVLEAALASPQVAPAPSRLRGATSRRRRWPAAS